MSTMIGIIKVILLLILSSYKKAILALSVVQLLILQRGKVGQVFKLGTKYSESIQAYYKDENMHEKIIVMGCYGIGISRTLAAIVEQHHDENGIIWPISVAPTA